MTFLTQSRFPTLWGIFQYCIGGTVDKRRLCLLKYRGQKQILEVGCSLGNIAKVFLKLPHVKYMGIDIDPVVIRYAQRNFASYPNFRFLCQDLRSFAQQSDEKFDYILFAGILHHIDDKLAQSLLEAAKWLMPNDGSLVVVDPLMPELEDNWLIRWFIKLEQSRYVRKESEMCRLLHNVSGFQLEEAEVHYVGATPFSVPKCARFGVYELVPRQPGDAVTLSRSLSGVE